MIYKAVFLLLALAVSKTVVAQQCSTQQSDGSGVPDQGRNASDLQQVVTTRYCLLNDCTIMDYETGQHLNIIYTTDSLLVVTPKGNHTSMVVTKQEEYFDGFKCDRVFSFVSPYVLIPTSMLAADFLMSVYISIMHIMIRENHTSFGVLVVLYNTAIICRCVAAFASLLMHRSYMVHSQPVCYTVLFAVMQGLMFIEELGVCVLAHIAATMYYSYKFRTNMPVKKLFVYYVTYVLCMHGLFNATIIVYDIVTGEYRRVIRPDGRCGSLLDEYYNTQKIAWFSTIVNKMIQITLFTIFLVYYYKYLMSGLENSAPGRRLSKMLFKIAIIMGATVGISQVMWFLASLVDKALSINGMMPAAFGMMQQITITVMLSSKWVSQLYNKYCSKQRW